MAPDQAYRWLMSACAPSAGDGFDQHVFASILSLAIGQMAERQVSLAVTSGLDSVALAEIGAQLFPDAAPALAAMAQGATPIVEIEEQSIREILLMYASTPLPLSRPLAQLLARRCNEPHHLWQDLGLRNRGELSTLMERHFARLRTRNQNDMKWKKFLFRMVCGSEGFTLCPAPVCTECDDFAGCFGGEDGIAQLTHSHGDDIPPAAFVEENHSAH